MLALHLMPRELLQELRVRAAGASKKDFQVGVCGFACSGRWNLHAQLSVEACAGLGICDVLFARSFGCCVVLFEPSFGCCCVLFEPSAQVTARCRRCHVAAWQW
jgi:hypothetical protein